MENKKTITLSLDKDLINQLKKDSGDIPISSYINKLLKKVIEVKGGEK